jgi:hypothetical protein
MSAARMGEVISYLPKTVLNEATNQIGVSCAGKVSSLRRPRLKPFFR